MGESTKSWPTLYTKGRDGALRQWSIKAQGDKIITTHGIVGGEQVTSERIATPKNVGRSNETTGAQQAILEAQAEHKHKLDRKYTLTQEGTDETVRLPMLAKEYKKQKGVKFPVRVQRKLNGVRSRATREDGKVILYSRGGKVWERVPHINEAVSQTLPPGDEFDGEIYLHGVDLQDIARAIKNPSNPLNLRLQYHIYDMPIVGGREDLPWTEREDALIDTFFNRESATDVMQFVRGFDADSEEQVKALHDEFVADGYEGAIIRIPDGRYEWGLKRSPSLLKFKEFEDNEFKIVGFGQGEGTESGLVLWQCVTQEGLQFTARPRGSHADRGWLLEHGDGYVGEMLKVRHFGWTKDKLPFHPVGEAIRLPEDL